MSEPGPRIVIVGAGAMGVSVAQHLTLAGAKISFLVRSGRAANAPDCYQLYSYDDAELHELKGFGVTDDPAGIADIDPAFVLSALDGASLASADGRALLTEIGDAIRDTGAVLIVGGVGIGLRELAMEASRLPDDRVVGGMIGLVVHAVGIDLPAHPPTDPARLAKADYAFRHLNEGGFLLENRNEAAAARFAALFDKSGAKCFVAPPEEFGVQSRGIMPVFITAEILGWPEADAMFADPLWPVTVEAVQSIQALDEHGAAGKAAAGSTTRESLAGLWTYLEQAALPLDWQAFNAHQHGDKVKAADALLFRACIERGTAQGHDMSALTDLVRRHQAHLENANG